jgi:hypothetical protein
MKDEAKALYVVAREAHARTVTLLTHLANTMRGEDSMTETLDAAYALNECSKLIDDCRKQLNLAREEYSKRTAILWVRTGEAEPIRTGRVTSTPEVGLTVITPKKGTAEYVDFCLHYGIDPNSPFRPHWPDMIEKITQDARDGKPLPPGCDPSKQHSTYKTPFRATKGVLQEGDKSYDELKDFRDPDILSEVYQTCNALWKLDALYGQLAPAMASLHTSLIEQGKRVAAKDETTAVAFNPPDAEELF